ncbi:MAG: hypothetical protein H6797_02195 [Candidatus Nomurabacteria bacterium]|nr:MAG: hypothetical protein H6797_02195 [Candidatus Nomurabacteria bacterium]
MKRKSISLIGMPACGKSTIGKELAKVLGMPLLDVDKWMEEREGMPLREVIETKGKDYTLRLETDCIRSHDLHDVILSTPGSIIYNDVLDVLQEQTHIVWLNVPFAAIEERLAPDVDNKRGVIGLKEKGLKRLFDERTPFYAEWATSVIDCGSKSATDIVDEIVGIFRK